MSKFEHGNISGTPGGNGNHTFSDNLPDLVKVYPLDHGHFGKPSDKKHSIARIIESDDPVREAERFYRLATEGAKERKDKEGFHLAQLKDGSFITFREVSSSEDKSPAVDINLVPPKSIKTTKIHFVKKEQK